MNVAELIEVLKKYLQDLTVVHEMWSEQNILKEEDIRVADLCLARPDGWVANKRPDKPNVRYLVIP